MIDIEYYLNKLSNDKFAIFLFHGVIDKTDSKVRNYTKKHLLQEEFKELIKQLKNTGHPLSMEDICNLNQTKQPPPPNSYAITFDDGFENNFTLAAPILEHFSTPGCFYVSTGLIENNEMTWIDKIEYCLEVIDNANIKLPWDEEYTYVFNSKTKITFLERLRNKVKANQKFISNDEIVNLIFNQCDQPIINDSSHILDQKMSWDQVKRLNSNSLFTVAGHSHSHVSLASLNQLDLELEISKSLELLKNNADIETKHYSYPEGQEIDYSENVIKCLKDNNILCCPTAIDGMNNENTDLFHLKRVMVH